MTVDPNDQAPEDEDLQKAPVESSPPTQSTAPIGFWASVALLAAATVAAAYFAFVWRPQPASLSVAPSTAGHPTSRDLSPPFGEGAIK